MEWLPDDVGLARRGARETVVPDLKGGESYMLAIENLEVSYQGVITAVRGVSLEVPDHGVVALLGANGAGKTTILRAISGLLPLHGGRVTHGSIHLNGRPSTSLDPT